MSALFEKHKQLLDEAIQATRNRTFWAAYPEHPKAYGEAAPGEGEVEYKAYLNHEFTGLIQPKSESFTGEEVSPYTQEKLGVRYPLYTVEELIGRAGTAGESWKKTSAEERAGILMECLEEIKKHFFAIAHATMHTTGQTFIMSFQASGPHSNDRALEPVAIGYEELKRFPQGILWEKPMGKFALRMEKEYHAVPRGIGLVIGCSTFPVWNTVPGVFADLMTGNPVIIKPHPGAVLPIAIVAAAIQKVFQLNGVDPNTVQLAADSSAQPLTKALAEHPAVKLIDYTGGSAFGEYIESLKNKIVFTEKAGVNSVILDSVDDLDAVLGNLAFSVSLYSGQMCTAPQNFFIPEKIKAGDTEIGFEEVVHKFAGQLAAISTNPKMGAGVLGAIQNPKTLQRVAETGSLGAGSALQSAEVKSEEFPHTRTVSPVLLEAGATDITIYSKELFGPIAICIKTKDTAESVSLASQMAREHGAITCAAYSTNPATRHLIQEAMEATFTPVSFNLTGPIWVNQHAAFSDFHVTGGNPAGNATFSNPEFLVKRFVWVGHRRLV